MLKWIQCLKYVSLIDGHLLFTTAPCCSTPYSRGGPFQEQEVPSTLDRRGIPAPGHFANAIGRAGLEVFAVGFSTTAPASEVSYCVHTKMSVASLPPVTENHLQSNTFQKTSKALAPLFISQHTRGEAKQRKNTKTSVLGTIAARLAFAPLARDCNKLHKANYRRCLASLFNRNITHTRRSF